MLPLKNPLPILAKSLWFRLRDFRHSELVAPEVAPNRNRLRAIE